MKAKDIKPMNGYVLVKADKHHSTYQLKGRETGILVSNHSIINHDGVSKIQDESHKNYSVKATVLKTPISINLPDDKFKNMDRGMITEGDNIGQYRCISTANRFKEYEKTVLKYGTEVEIKEGDRVHMSWRVHEVSHHIETEDFGEVMFVKYDELVMTVDSEGNPLKMLNGWVLMEQIEQDGIETENGVSFKKSNSGLLLPLMNDRSKNVRSGKRIWCKCKLAGKPNSSYKNFDGKDEDYDISEGEKIIADKRGCRNLEQINHMYYEEKYIITHRRSIIFTERTAAKIGLDFEKIN